VTRTGYDQRTVDPRWRHLDLGGHRLVLTMRRRRLACPSHGLITQAVPFARAGSGFTTDFEDLVVWLTARADKTTVSTFARVAWRTVGAMCQRMSAEKLDPDRLVGHPVGAGQKRRRPHRQAGSHPCCPAQTRWGGVRGDVLGPVGGGSAGEGWGARYDFTQPYPESC